MCARATSGSYQPSAGSYTPPPSSTRARCPTARDQAASSTQCLYVRYLHSMTCANFDPRKCQASTPLVPMWDELQALSRAPGESHQWMLSAPLPPSHLASSPAMAPFSLSSSSYGTISPSLSSSSYGTIQPSALLSQHCLHTC